MVPGAANLPPRKRGKAVGLYLALGFFAFVGGAVLSYLLGWGGDTVTQKPRTANEQKAAETLDQEETPFTVAIEYDHSPPDIWTVVLDRTLTEEEQREFSMLSGWEEVRQYLTSLGGRTLRYPPLFEASSLPHKLWGTDSTVFTMNLFSKRDAQLSIVDMQAVNVSCQEPTAKAVFVAPPQGGAAYDGILYDLARPGFGPIITDEEHQGEHYFSRRKIDLGGGESPGGLRVEALTRGKSCTWEIEARYHDAYQNTGSLMLKDGKKPFYAEAAPARPQQLWVFNAGAQAGEQPWVPCHTEVDDLNCESWLEQRALSSEVAAPASD